jgi:ParB-like chromosome segregation protein Spo0J
MPPSTVPFLVWIPIEQLVKAEWNYKKNDDAMLKKLIENLRRNSQVENIVVRDLGNWRYEIVNGNHRYDAMVALGIKTVACINVGPIDLISAKRLAIELNETRFPNDYLSLSERLIELTKQYIPADLAETLPYSENEINEFVNMVRRKWKSTPSDKEITLAITMTRDQLKLWKTFVEGGKFQDDSDAFTILIDEVRTFYDVK